MFHRNCINLVLLASVLIYHVAALPGENEEVDPVPTAVDDIPSDVKNFLLRDASDSGDSVSESSAPKLLRIVKFLYKECRKPLANLQLTRINGGYYYYYNDASGPRLNWFDARNWCANRGMSLVSLETEKESRAVTEYLRRLLEAETPGANSVYWTSGNTLGNQDQHMWLTGSPFSYFNWGPNQPSNGNNQNCVVIHKQAVGLNWAVIQCVARRARFICEVRNPCSNIFNIYRSLKDKHGNHHHSHHHDSHDHGSHHHSHGSHSHFDSTAIHRRNSDSDRSSDSHHHDRSSDSHHNDRSTEEVIILQKPNKLGLGSAVNLIGDHIKDKFEMLGGLLGHKDQLVPQIVIQKPIHRSSSRSDSSNHRDSHSRDSHSNNDSSDNNDSSNHRDSHSRDSNNDSSDNNDSSNNNDSSDNNDSESLSVGSIHLSRSSEDSNSSS